jgi:hypothetical protein
MGKFSKIFHHIESKDLRNKYEQKKAAKIQEEKNKEDTKKYIASAMEQIKYNWRSDIDVGEAIREGMTTSDVTVSKETDAAPGDGEVSSTDPTNAASYTATTGIFAPGDDLGANVGTQIRASGSGSGQDGGFNVGGNYLAFQGTGTDDSANSRFAVLSAVDSTDVDTLQIKAIVGNDSNGGEDPDENGEQLYVMYKTPAMDQAMFLIQKPDGSVPDGTDVTSDQIIPLGAAPTSGLNDYSVSIPDYARAAGTQFILLQAFSSGPTFDNYGVTEIKFQRKTPITVFVSLDNPEASSFIRGAEQGSTPKKRKKDVDDKLTASDEYTTFKFGNEFPGQEVRVGGEDPFKGTKIGDDVEPSPQGKDEVKKSFGDFNNKASATSPRSPSTAQPEAEPEPVAPSAQTTMAPTTDDGEELPVKTVGGKNSGVVQGADAATLDAQEPETTEPETTEPETTEPETTEPEAIEPEPPDETKTSDEVEEIENEKYNAKADESANAIDNLIDFRLDQGLKSFNAIAQVTGVVINTAVNIGAFAANVLGFKEANGFVSMIGKIQNSIDIARSVLSGKVTNANVLPQEIKSFTDSMKLDEFQAKKIFISDVRHEYADDNIYVKDGKIYQNGDGKNKKGLYATPLANQGFETLDTHGSGYAQMIIPKDGSEPYLHYYDHNYENLNNAGDVNPTGGIIQSIDEIWSSLFGPEDWTAPDGRVYKGLGKANPVDIVAAGFKSISHVIHQLKSANTKFLPTRLKDSMLTYFGSFDQVYEGLLKTSIEGFPPGIHGSALTDFKVPLSKLPQETQDMIAGHPLSWTPERIENMTPEQINEQLYPLLETEEQFQNYLDFTTDITKMSTEPVNTVPFAVAMQEMDEIYSEFEPFDQEFNELLEKPYNESPFTQAQRAAYEDMQTLTAQNDEDIKENQNKLGPSAQSALWDKLVKPAYDAFVKATTTPGGSVSGNSPIKKRLDSQYAKYKKQADKMDEDYYRIQREINEKYYEQYDKLSEYLNAQAVSRSVEGYEGYPTTVDEKGRENYTTLDGEVITSRFNQIKAHVDVANQVYDQMNALYEPVADLQKYVDGAFVREGIGQQFEKDYGFSGDNWSPAKSGDGKPRGGSGKPKSDPNPDPRFAYAGTGADASTFAFDGGGGNVDSLIASAKSDAQELRWILQSGMPLTEKQKNDIINKINGLKKAEQQLGGNTQVAHYQPKGDNILEKYARPQPRRGLFEKVKSKGFFNQNDIKPIFPENPPPKLDPKTGMHPQYGKKAGRYKKLDPISANSMPPTGDPEIDAVVNKQKTINKIKKMARNK